MPPGAITLHKGVTFPGPLSCRPNRCWPNQWQVHHPKGQLFAKGWLWSQALPFQQFHVLFDSIFKVLFIFRSLYLCAIGLSPIFSFRWNLPPILSCIPKQLDSSKELHTGAATGHVRDSHPLWRPVPRNLDRGHTRSILSKLQLGPRGGQISNLSCCRFTRRYWGNPCWFLFLRLLICLSSAGAPTWSEVNLRCGWSLAGRHAARAPEREKSTALGAWPRPPLVLGRAPGDGGRTQRRAPGSSRVVTTLGQAYPLSARGCNVRSKIRWFTEFCDSHYLSHFAAFFIDARTKRSVVESFNLFYMTLRLHTTRVLWSSGRHGPAYRRRPPGRGRACQSNSGTVVRGGRLPGGSAR